MYMYMPRAPSCMPLNVCIQLGVCVCACRSVMLLLHKLPKAAATHIHRLKVTQRQLCHIHSQHYLVHTVHACELGLATNKRHALSCTNKALIQGLKTADTRTLNTAAAARGRIGGVQLWWLQLVPACPDHHHTHSEDSNTTDTTLTHSTLHWQQTHAPTTSKQHTPLTQ